MDGSVRHNAKGNEPHARTAHSLSNAKAKAKIALNVRQQFLEAVDVGIRVARERLALVGKHCTHGLKYRTELH